MTALTPINIPFAAPPLTLGNTVNFPGQVYSYYGYTVLLDAGDSQILFMPVQVSWHNISLILSDPSNTQIDVSLSSNSDYLADPDTLSDVLWATNINSGVTTAFQEISSPVHMIRITNTGSSPGQRTDILA